MEETAMEEKSTRLAVAVPKGLGSHRSLSEVPTPPPFTPKVPSPPPSTPERTVDAWSYWESVTPAEVQGKAISSWSDTYPGRLIPVHPFSPPALPKLEND